MRGFALLLIMMAVVFSITLTIGILGEVGVFPWAAEATGELFVVSGIGFFLVLVGDMVSRRTQHK